MINGKIPGEWSGFSPRPGFEGDCVLRPEPVEKLVAIVRGRYGFIKGGRLETPADIGIDLALVIPFIKRAKLRVDAPVVLGIGLVPVRRRVQAVTIVPLDVSDLATCKNREGLGEVVLVLRVENHVGGKSPVRRYHGAPDAIEVLKTGVHLRFKGGIDAKGKSVSLAEQFRVRLKGGVGSKIIRMKTYNAEGIVDVKFLALKLYAVIIVTAHLQLPVIAFYQEAVDHPAILPVRVPILGDGLRTGLGGV